MKKVNLATADRSLAEYAAELRDEIVLLTKRKCPVAALVPLKNVDRESLALSHHPEFLELIAQSRAVLPERSPNNRMPPSPKKAAPG